MWGSTAPAQSQSGPLLMSSSPSASRAPRSPRRSSSLQDPSSLQEEEATRPETARSSPAPSQTESAPHEMERSASASPGASLAEVPRPDGPHTKLLMVDFRSGETVCTHPDVASYLDDGWHVQSAAPRVTDEGTRLLVVLTRFPPAASSASR